MFLGHLRGFSPRIMMMMMILYITYKKYAHAQTSIIIGDILGTCQLANYIYIINVVQNVKRQKTLILHNHIYYYFKIPFP